MKCIRLFFLMLFCLGILTGIAYSQQDDVEKQLLLKRIEDLENRINELSEESRARRKLQITEEEKQEKEKEVLEAVEGDYTLEPRHTLSVNYSLGYSYSPSETLITTLEEQVEVAREANHTIKHTISTGYSILNNLSVSSSIPFVYRYNKLGTEEELDETDIGDISVGMAFQPYIAKVGQVRSTISLSATLPTGRNPYEINTDTELSTGSGFYTFDVSGSFSKQIDPVVAFWSVQYSHSLPQTSLDFAVAENVFLRKVKPGDSLGVGAGLGYAMSYKVSVNASFAYTYQLGSTYSYRDIGLETESGDSVAGTISIGLGWRVSPQTTLSLGLGYTLTGSGFSLSFRVPFSYVM